MKKIIFFIALGIISVNIHAQNSQTVEPEMVFVQGGTFQMGCGNEQRGCYYYEKPSHSVTVSDFSIGKYEVTQAQWQAVMDTNPSRFKGDNLPVDNVNWNDTQEFIQKLNAMTGKNYRLPTEAEWEYAARGGNKSKGYIYSGSNNVDDVAWYRDNSDSTHATGTKLSNELGIYDLTGNVWEWCFDAHTDYPDSAQINPVVVAYSNSLRMLRGGDWNGDAKYVRVTYRNWASPNYHTNEFGFRLVLGGHVIDTIPQAPPVPPPAPEPTFEERTANSIDYIAKRNDSQEDRIKQLEKENQELRKEISDLKEYVNENIEWISTGSYGGSSSSASRESSLMGLREQINYLQNEINNLRYELQRK